ncbi:hypothetical protein SAMN04487968_110121 [Nocardioides terrae]|uniref:Uncharacterized protein n=1 Tax=Nocardioides terrae TaxID=574651 RepID=A0A1I1LWS2_9ACTN|nr:hypothetical protein [Nocardioides terrae]SFC73920.1 hypothetical protein SAMN04487968_110121 [Nocardioides terrae]
MTQVAAVLDVTRPFSRAEAAAAGLALAELRRVTYRVVFPGVYLGAGTELTPALRAEAALVPFPANAVASHASAARILGLPIPTLPDEHVTVLQQRDRRHRRGIRCHLATTTCVMNVRGVRVSTYEQTFVELAELIPLVDLVVVGDHLVRKGQTTIEKLVGFCATSPHPGAAGSPGSRGIRAPRRRLAHGDAAADAHRSGGAARACRQPHHPGRLRPAGIFEHPERTLAKIHRLLQERGEPGAPLRPSDAWRPHFPGRS